MDVYISAYFGKKLFASRYALSMLSIEEKVFDLKQLAFLFAVGCLRLGCHDVALAAQSQLLLSMSLE